VKKANIRGDMELPPRCIGLGKGDNVRGMRTDVNGMDVKENL